ncbi:MAG: cyclic pyranopterin monophosphate synthase MoaC [Gammaproteobacteria bacterium]|nr:cyclic pyranopterin monophosphate synthase MoaC [Gammaproteobacteria bacterium]MDE2251763.1 cyclic pyranopterin monophosphate synthase MoaC [Gammaproteobacteria bacterium]
MATRRGKAGLSHLDARRTPTMVGVGAKPVTHRSAEAQARMQLPAAVARALRATGHRTAKGPVFDTAIIAGVMAAKRTAGIIPFCHPLPIEHCTIDIRAVSRNQLRIRCRVETHHKTGVEMEALTGASIAALTIYDMCKALSHEIRISELRLLRKSGGRRDVGRRGAGRSR